MVVHTYPSPEATLEYNSKDSPNKLVTKLYQTSTVTWTTTSTTDIPNYAKTTATTEETLKLQHVKSQTSETLTNDKIIPAPNNNNEEEDDYYYDEGSGFSANTEDHDIDVKRSAEDIRNKTPLDPKGELKILDNSTSLPALESNNYTNFTDHYPTNSTNTTANIINAATIANTTTTNSSSDSLVANATSTTTQKATAATSTSTTTNLTTQLPQAPSTPKIVKAQATGLDWLNTVAAQSPPAHVTTDVTQNFADEPHKIPFTLENVNKPEDLRREESEHRSRKSKGLSADYKVNYSSDSKNFYTRSAATTVNEYESEESSNISSEALSVQVRK